MVKKIFIVIIVLLTISIVSLGQDRVEKPASRYNFISGNKLVVVLIPVANKVGYPLDSFILYVKKSQVYWKSDDILIIKKP